jgi:hypothetical protein
MGQLRGYTVSISTSSLCLDIENRRCKINMQIGGVRDWSKIIVSDFDRTWTKPLSGSQRRAARTAIPPPIGSGESVNV